MIRIVPGDQNTLEVLLPQPKPVKKCESDNVAPFICVNVNCWSPDKLICEGQSCSCQYNHLQCEKLECSKMQQLIRGRPYSSTSRGLKMFNWFLKQKAFYKQKLKNLYQLCNFQTLHKKVQIQGNDLYQSLRNGKVLSDYPIGHYVLKGIRMEVNTNTQEIDNLLEQYSSRMSQLYRSFDTTKLYFQELAKKSWFYNKQQIVSNDIQYPQLIAGMKAASSSLKNFNKLDIKFKGDHVYQNFQDAFPNLKQLKVNVFKNLKSTAQKVFSNFLHLKKLQLEQINLKRNTLEIPTLQSLSIVNSYIGKNVLPSITASAHNLRYLKLSSRIVTSFKRALPSLFRRHPELEVLDLKCIKMSNPCLHVLSTSLKYLKRLCYINSIPLRDQNIVFFDRMPSVTYLSLDVQLSSDGVQTLLTTFPSLTTLIIKTNSFKNYLIMHIYNIIPNIQNLQIFSSQYHAEIQLTNSAIKYLSKLSKLKTLHIINATRLVLNYYPLLNLKKLTTIDTITTPCVNRYETIHVGRNSSFFNRNNRLVIRPTP